MSQSFNRVWVQLAIFIFPSISKSLIKWAYRSNLFSSQLFCSTYCINNTMKLSFEMETTNCWCTYLCLLVFIIFTNLYLVNLISNRVSNHWVHFQYYLIFKIYKKIMNVALLEKSATFTNLNVQNLETKLSKWRSKIWTFKIYGGCAVLNGQSLDIQLSK
jgi:hypothetical protein